MSFRKVDSCHKFQFTWYWSDGTPRKVECEISKISGHPKYPDGWYLLISDVMCPAQRCIVCGKDLSEKAKS